MPTLLWRVLSSMGHPEGREPRYYWDKEPLGDETLVGIEAVVPTSGATPPGAAGCTSTEVPCLSTVPAGQLSQF